MRQRVTRNERTITDANQNNLAIGGSYSYVVLNGTLTATRTITGIKSGLSGEILYLRNKTGQTLTLAANNSGSNAGNRFAAAWSLLNNSGVVLIYDGTEDKWVPFAG